MKPKRVIIDTGPLVAFLNKSDFFHSWALTQFAQLNPPFFTCESVISEVCFLLRNAERGYQNILSLLERDLIQIPFKLDLEISNINNLMKKYKKAK